jgi:hypothetical protein
MATQIYRPGDIVPQDGVVVCTQYPGTRDRVRKGRPPQLKSRRSELDAVPR